MADNSDYSGFLSEELNERLNAIQEGLEPLQTVPGDIREIKVRLDRLEASQEVFKLVAKDLSKIVNNHESRITKLEAA